MLILTMLRNFLPAHEQIASGGWDVGAAAQKAYDLENKVVGIAGAGRIGQLTMERLKVRRDVGLSEVGPVKLLAGTFGSPQWSGSR